MSHISVGPNAHDIQLASLRGWLVLVSFGILFIPAFTLFSNSAARFVVYVLPFLSIVFWVFSSASSHFKTNIRFVVALMVYCLVVVISLTAQWEFVDKLTWINGFRPIFYLVAFIPFMIFSDRSVKALIIIFALTSGALWLTGSGTTRGEFDLSASRGPLESGLAFPLGGILLYTLIRKKYLWSFITLILFFLAFKRIAIGAVLLVAVLMFLTRLCSEIWRLSHRQCATVALLVIAICGVLFNVYYSEVFTYIAQFLSTPQSINSLTMGRLEEFEILQGQYGEQSWFNLFFGNGPGDATRKLIEVTITYPLQVHNSYLLYFYDFGVVGFMLLIAAFWFIYSQNVFGIYLLIYNLIIMITDNNFSHHYHQITYFILIAAMQFEIEGEQTNESG